MDPMIPITLGVALTGGAVGKAVGNSPLTGPQPWGKVLAPLLATLFPILYKKFGGDLSIEEATQIGLAFGAAAVGVVSAGKNAWQLLKSLFPKKLIVP